MQVPDNFKLLLLSWKEQIGKPRLDKAKTELFIQLLAAEQRNTKTTLDVKKVLAAIKRKKLDIKFPNLFDKAGDSYTWHQLQTAATHNKVLNQLAKAIQKTGSEDDAIKLYQAYPRHLARGAAITAIMKAIKWCKEQWPEQKDTVEFLLERVKSYANHVQGKDPQFIPYPATWFNRRQFLDEWEEDTSDRDGGIKRDTEWKPAGTGRGVSLDDLIAQEDAKHKENGNGKGILRCV